MATNALSITIDFTDSIIDEMVSTIDKHTHKLKDSVLQISSKPNKNVRSSKSLTIPSNMWVVGMLYYYVQLANRQNFMYDIIDYEGLSLQYIEYNEGDFYSWHEDFSMGFLGQDRDPLSTKQPSAQPPIEYTRKISFSLQLNDDYTGGDLQLYQPNGRRIQTIPPKKGLMTIFDSRTLHRVRKVKSGTRKSIVGWVSGPRWR